MSIPTKEEALDIAKRYIDCAFQNKGELPRHSIPANPDRDDDIRLIEFIQNAIQPPTRQEGETPTLEWKVDPTNSQRLLASSRKTPGITLFEIEICDDRDDRGRLNGAFVPDEIEQTDALSRAKIPWLKAQAAYLMRDFLMKHESDELSAKQAEVERLTELVEYAKMHGLVVGKLVTTDRPEGYLAHDYRKGSTLDRIFKEWSDSIGLKSELESLKAAQGWNPIETAPKDGSNILATWIDTWADAPHIESVTWSGDHWFYTYDGDSPQKGNEPTHWMPLPIPPVERSENKG